MKAGKVWGTTQQIWANGSFEMHRLEIKAGAECSEHKHNQKYNLFFVESGVLKIRTWKNAYDLIDETILNAGETFVQEPGEFHQFVCLADCICFEVYWAKFDSNDIERRTVGKSI